MVSGRGGKRGEHDRNRRIVRLRDGDMDLALVAHDVFARSLDSSTTSHAVVFRRAVNRHSATPLVEWAGACRCPATGRCAECVREPNGVAGRSLSGRVSTDLEN